MLINLPAELVHRVAALRFSDDHLELLTQLQFEFKLAIGNDELGAERCVVVVVVVFDMVAAVVGVVVVVVGVVAVLVVVTTTTGGTESQSAKKAAGAAMASTPVTSVISASTGRTGLPTAGDLISALGRRLLSHSASKVFHLSPIRTDVPHGE